MQETIGKRLSLARESKGLSLEDAHKATRIHINILSALEEDRFDEILNPIYVKSFLRRYAHYLGLPQDEILKEYSALKSPIKEQVLAADNTNSSRKGKSLKYAAIFLAAAVLTICLIWLIAALKPIRLFKAAKHPRKRAVAAVNRPTEKPLLVPKGEPLRLTVKANDNSWMHVKADGKIVFQNILQKGSQETWRANDKVELWVGNAAALELNLNGRPLGSPGRGVIKNILVTREGMSKENK